MAYKDEAGVVVEALSNYLDESRSRAGGSGSEMPVIRQRPLGEVIEGLQLADLARNGGLMGERLSRFVDEYLLGTTRLHSPTFMAHQVAPPHESGSLGALIDGLTNNAMAIYEMGPAAASIEYFVVNWMLEKAGWLPAPTTKLPQHWAEEFGGGVLTHGGSLANLTALLAARNAAAPESWEEGVPRDLVLLAPAPSHYSVARSASILGLGQRGLALLPVDREGRVIPKGVVDTIQGLRSAGMRPFALVANCCQTANGLYDPLEELAGICRSEEVWLHVDGAHGAGVLLSPRLRHLLAGIEWANSLTWDAHKMLRAPTLCAALLTRRHQWIDSVFQQDASYLFHDKEMPGFDFGSRTVECTKAGLGLRFFMVLGALGEQALGRYVEQQYALARDAWQLISERPGFSCPVRPDSNIVCFRVQGEDEFQLAIRDKLIAQGNFYVSSAVTCGERCLRLVLINPDTRLSHIEDLIVSIEQIVRTW